MIELWRNCPNNQYDITELFGIEMFSEVLNFSVAPLENFNNKVAIFIISKQRQQKLQFPVLPRKI